MTTPGKPLLEVRNLGIRFGGLIAVEDLSFDVRADAITAVIGPNGAGKTTIFNCITGFYRPRIGSIALNRSEGTFHLERMSDHRIARDAGVARTFQNIRLFPRMTVIENLMVARHAALTRNWLLSAAGLLKLAPFARAERDSIDLARSWLDRMGLLGKANWPAGSLPYGDQRRLEIVRALCTDPVLLCLDEPAAGLNPRESRELADLLRTIRDEYGIAVLLIEHDMSVVMSISDHVVVVDRGRKIAEGPPAAVRVNPAVVRAYLGEEEGEEASSETTPEARSVHA